VIGNWRIKKIMIILEGYDFHFMWKEYNDSYRISIEKECGNIKLMQHNFDIEELSHSICQNADKLIKKLFSLLTHISCVRYAARMDKLFFHAR
jgi:hypothetical protein